MATQPPPAPSSASLPDYIQAAKPNPPTNRAPWYKNTAPTYAGIFLWFAFWDAMPNNGLHQGGLMAALVGILLAALICHFLFYLVPGLLGMKTGLPLYIVGTSTFGTVGGLLMPGFLMGLLQFGWLAVNTYYSSRFLAEGILGSTEHPSFQPIFYTFCVIWTLAAAFVGLKGIQYVAKVATYLPLIPLAVLLIGLSQFGPGATSYQPVNPIEESSEFMLWGSLMMVGQIVGFFATAGAAGVDFGMNSRNRSDVQWGGIVGIVLAILFTAGAATLIVAGAWAQGLSVPDYQVTSALRTVTEDWVFLKMPVYRMIMVGLPIAAFPGACFSSFIAANSFKTVMPRVSPFLSVGIGAVVSIILAVTGVAGQLAVVFGIIGASFGPICGAMMIDYLHSGRKWSGPRAGFNPAGWVAWLLGFIVGILPNDLIKPLLTNNLPENIATTLTTIPAAPVAAFLVGALVYFVMASAGLQSRVIPYAPAAQQAA